MEISDVEIHEFTYRLEDVTQENGHQVYSPGNVLEPPGFVLTIRTTDGLEGHYRGFMFVDPMVTQVKMAAPEFLVGSDPLRREEIWYDIWRAFRHTDHLGLGPIDIALWDLAGNHFGASVGELLGKYRDRLPSYASTYWADREEGGLNGPEAYADFARECVNRGYPGFKIHPDPHGDPDRDIEICRAVAEEVGKEVDLMLDPTSEYETYVDALRVGRALDDCGFYWYEDPLSDSGESTTAHEKLVENLDTPVLGLEHSRTGPFGRANHAIAGSLDIARGDAHLDGGITGAIKIARAVESLGLDVEYHTGGPAHLQVLSAIRNSNYYEDVLMHPQGIDWMMAQGFSEPVDELNKDGTVSVPDGPGLGVEIDWKFVEERQTDHTVIADQGASGTS